MSIKYKAYRYFNMTLHKMNLHYAPPNPNTIREENHKTVGSVHKNVISHHWCKWCGLRGDVIEVKLREMH